MRDCGMSQLASGNKGDENKNVLARFDYRLVLSSSPHFRVLYLRFSTQVLVPEDGDI